MPFRTRPDLRALAPWVACLALVASAAAPASAAAARGFTTGVTDNVYVESADRNAWLDRTVASGASIVRLNAIWDAIAPAQPPPGFDAADPGGPGYSFAGLDASVRAARVRGLDVLVLFYQAPSWAEGAGRSASAGRGTWKPDPTATGQFAEALARRYSGAYPDPLAPGQALPQVHRFQVWNETNLSAYLAPQWVRRGRFWDAVSPEHYRLMLNAAYRAIKRAQPGATVVTAGTAPFGEPDGGPRMQPARFVRQLLCLWGRRLLLLSCPDPALFDVLDHHPYGYGGPRTRALGTDEVSVPDLAKLTRVLRKAERTGRALPPGRKRFWTTEISWDSSPPDPDGVPAGTHARWLEEAFYLLWKGGVDTTFWFQVRDQAPVPSYAATNQSGLYLRDGTAKLAVQAFRFPFVSERVSRVAVRAWGKAPVLGMLRIQRLSQGRWVTIKRLQVSSNRVFDVRLTLRGRATLRAVIGAFTSLTWRQG